MCGGRKIAARRAYTHFAHFLLAGTDVRLDEQFPRAEREGSPEDAQHQPRLIHERADGGALGGNALVGREILVGCFQDIEVGLRVVDKVCETRSDGGMAAPNISGDGLASCDSVCGSLSAGNRW